MVLYTKLALADEFKRLEKIMPVNDITVKKLTTGTGMNHKTFYYHFDGMVGLMKFIFERELVSLFEDSPVSGYDDWGDGVLKIMQYVKDNEKLLRSIAKSKYWPEMRFFFSSMYERYCACLLREVVKIVSETDGVESGISEEAFDLNVSFYGLLFYTYMEKWFFEGIKIPKEQFFKNCIDVVGEKAMHDAVRRFRSQSR